MSDTTERPNGELIADHDLQEMLRREKARSQALSQRADVAEAERQRAERERDEARGTVGQEADRRWAAEAEALEAQLAQATGQADALERQIEQLQSEGNYAEAAKAVRQMTMAATLIGQIEQKKQWIAETKALQKQQVEQQSRQRQDQPRQQQGQADPLAQYSVKVRAWIEEHPDFLTDAKFRARALAAHHQAEAEGIVVDSDEYFDLINENIGRGQQQPQPRRRAPAEQMGMDEDEEEQPGREPAYPQRRQAPALPVSRRVPDGNGGQRRGEVRLTPDEREHADITMSHVLDPSERYIQYAELRTQLKAQGRMN